MEDAVKRQLTGIDEFFADDFADERLRQAYHEVTAEELGEILRYLATSAGLPRASSPNFWVSATAAGFPRSRAPRGFR